MRKVYSRPDLNEFDVQSVDVITTSDAALENIVQNIATANARTEVYDFTEFFGE